MPTFAMHSGPPHAGAHLEMTNVDHTHDTVTAALTGEIDFSNADRFTVMVLDLLQATGQPQVVLDLDEVGLVDSAGLRAVMTCREAAGAAGRTLVVDRPRPIVDRIVRLLDAACVLMPERIGRPSG